MAIKVRLSNAARVTRIQPEVRNGQPDLVEMSRLTYQALGSLIRNKALIERYKDGKIIGGTYINEELPLEYIRLLDELDLLQRNKYYGSNHIIRPAIIELDEYLGALGVDIDYPYVKDVVSIAPWVEATDQTPYRVLVDTRDNTYLTTNNGTEVLVVYT